MAESESSPPGESSQNGKRDNSGQKEEIKREIKQELAEALLGRGKPDGEGSQPAKKPDESKGGKEGDKKEEHKGFRWTPLKVIILLCAIVLVAVVAAYYIIYAMGHESTDDAYTTGFVHQISSRVTSNVTQLLIVDNQYVHQGQVLLQLDPRDFLVQVARAKANYEKAQADFDRVYAVRNDVAAISKSDYDQTKNNLDVAKAALDDANNQLSYCTIVAPTDGYIGNRTVEVGNRVTVGGALMAVVQDVWVLANYKETQLGKMKKNQPVVITVDAIPGHKFQGHVDSFSPGTGSTFALLPPDNATGNFTKIVQRVPVKILFEPDSIRDFRNRLVPGLSVETEVSLDQNVRPVGDQVIKAGQ
jgi:membrane fusion protein (multidrug efflux system)